MRTRFMKKLFLTKRVLIPVLIVVFVAAFLYFSGQSDVAPFIYTTF